jgi:hypothetical protein
MLATGSGAASRSIMGTAVFFGMLVATAVGVFIYPALFVLVQRLSGAKTPVAASTGPPAAAPASSHGGGH